MHELTQLIFHDMKPALGVTEPGAIALAVSTAKRHAPGAIQKITLRLNSGMYKNAFTCGIPGTDKVGNEYAAALGAIAADPEKGLECLDGITDAQVKEAQENGRVRPYPGRHERDHKPDLYRSLCVYGFRLGLRNHPGFPHKYR